MLSGWAGQFSQRKSQWAWSAFLTIAASFSVKGAVMKTDTVLTMDEYFAASCTATKHVNPPADNARHIPITSKVDARSEEHDCRCYRWGHPCAGCLEERKPRLCPASDELLL
jgi:hypothetical protein